MSAPPSPPNPPSAALVEALRLSEEALRNLEMNELPLTAIALKASRLARLLNDFEMQRLFQLEVSGYPIDPDGVGPEIWSLAIKANRVRREKALDGTMNATMFCESIDRLQANIDSSREQLAVAADPDVSVSSQNPYFVPSLKGNMQERLGLRGVIVEMTDKLASRRGMVYSYVMGRYYELKFSSAVGDVFAAVRIRVDHAIGNLLPESVKRLAAAYENLQSENPEDWSNAVHSCRRILCDLADAVFPPREDKIIAGSGGKEKKIKLGADQYINRIIAFVDERSTSGRFQEIVGAQLNYLGNRLDSIYSAATKGTHTTIVRKDEAERYLIYTYLLVGDILTLLPEPPQS